MRRSVPLAFVLALVWAPPALAVHHLMRVEEVAPGGSQAEQFIELRDPAAEPFPSEQYSVAATDAAGGVISGASQSLAPDPFRLSTARFVVGGTSIAARHTDLAFTIPPQAARVCFYDGGSPPAGPPINCLSYGAVAIPAGQSAQRQSCGSVAAATPTPGAANIETGACGGGSPPPTGGGGGGDASDLTPPQQKVAGKRRQDVDRLAVGVTLSEAGDVTVRGRVSLPAGAARIVRFRPVTRTAAANTPVRIRLRLARKARRAVKAALHDGRRLRARVTIAARDESGNVSTAKRAIRLTD